jgi:hypothetical protein
MHNQTLMEYVDAHRERNETGAVDVPWEEWGPHWTRFFVPVTVALVCPVLQPTGESRVEVLDFNAHCWRGEAYCGTYGYRYWATAGFVCKPSVFAVETVFANEMVTALPYYSMAASRQCELYVGHTIDEESCSGLRCI